MSAPAAPPAPAAAPGVSKGYWQLTWIQFRKRKDAYAGLFLLLLLFSMALTAPLLANNLPWYASGPEGVSFPLVRDFFFPLDHLDRFYNLLFVTLVLLGGAAGLGTAVRAKPPLGAAWLLAGLFAAVLVDQLAEMLIFLAYMVRLSPGAFPGLLGWITGLVQGGQGPEPAGIWAVRLAELGAIGFALRKIFQLYRQAQALGTRTLWVFAGVTLFLLLFFVSRTVGGRNVMPDRYRELKASGQGTVLMPLIPYGAKEPDSARTDHPPTAGHPLGCDNNGFDVLTRIIHGSRISLAVGFLAVGLALCIGILVGSMSGYFGGWFDLLSGRLIEVFVCFPSFFLILTIIAVAPRRSIFWVMFAIGLTGWTGIARLIRGEVLKVRQLDYIQAAKAIGMKNSRIIVRHILPNALAPVLVAATFGVAGAILSETGLGFLGLGVEPPTPSWGELLNQARQDPVRLWWLMLYPGLMIFMSVTLMNLVGEGLRDAMDPRLRK
ncbi:MAG: ABC transporter permease [Planctomycetota bacterium]|nr:ABC transporter permease [Planctomycetota bacterium]